MLLLSGPSGYRLEENKAVELGWGRQVAWSWDGDGESRAAAVTWEEVRRWEEQWECCGEYVYDIVNGM